MNTYLLFKTKSYIYTLVFPEADHVFVILDKNTLLATSEEYFLFGTTISDACAVMCSVKC